MRLSVCAFLCCAIATFSTTACRGGDEKTHVVIRGADAAPDSLGPGDVRIYNADSAIDLVLVGDKITSGLSQKIIDRVRRETATPTKDSGIAGAFASFIKSKVAGAIGSRVEYPLADLDDVSYDNGKLVFHWKRGHRHDLFEHSRVNGRETSESFRPDDAQRFVAAVRARLANKYY